MSGTAQKSGKTGRKKIQAESGEIAGIHFGNFSPHEKS
jgi:hypothetical protein